MKTFKHLLRKIGNRSGATAIEYALIGGIICLAVVAGASALGGATNETFTEVRERTWGG